MFKTTILACALAALVGCRERSTRVDNEPSFSRPVESERMTFETPGATEEHTVQPAPSVETPSTGMQTQSSGELSTTPSTAPITPATPGTRPADVDDDADTSSIPTTGGTNGISDDPRAGAGDTSGAGARAVTPQVPAPANPNVQPGQPTTGQPPVTLDPATPAGEGDGANATQSSGTSETASGHGSPTNTGTNSENAGTGGTDDPTR